MTSLSELAKAFLLCKLYFFVLACLYGPQFATSNMLCPLGYWPASMNTTGPYGTKSTFKLNYLKDTVHPVCQFCPGIGCYITRHEIPKDNVEVQTKDSLNTDEKEQLQVETTSSTEQVNSTNEDATSTEQPTEVKYSMSCSPNSQLPDPENIVIYLDCVMIGEKDRYYLFIYEPRFTMVSVPVVDCVDADFIEWIGNEVELLGLELGFRMKAIPPFLFLYHRRIMQALPTTSDNVDPEKARKRCPFVIDHSRKKPKKRDQRQQIVTPPIDRLLSGVLIIVVLLLIAGVITAFCFMNAEKLSLCKTRGRKRREREAAQAAAELAAEKAAKEAAVLAAAAAIGNSEQTIDGRPANSVAWHPIYGRFGAMMPPSMGGAFGTFAVSQPIMNMANASMASGSDIRNLNQ